ncbi:MAG TPA: type II toxin-antitoxin system VapB family antitoxin [Thermoanaerobaculia bacterium]|jgi:methionine salvage enolase-phosphatase E1
MKRTNVILDEKLLEEARRESGEKTYSGVIMKALTEYVRELRLSRALKALHGSATDDDFYPGYLEEHLYHPRYQKTPVGPPPSKLAAHERRLPQKKSAKRGPR